MKPNKFRIIRDKLGFTQEGMEQVLGVTQQAISQHENGSTKPAIAALKKYVALCEKHGIKLNGKKVTLELLTE